MCNAPSPDKARSEAQMYLWDQSAAEIIEAEADNQITANADT